MAQNLGIHHVDACVDRVGEDLAPRRLLEESLDPAVVVRHDDSELERVVHGFEANRHGRVFLEMEIDEALKIEVAERIPGDDQERFIELVGREANRPSGTEWRLLDRVRHLDAERVAVAEVTANRLREERDCDDDVAEAVRAQELEDVLHARLAHDRHHRFRLVRGERPESRSLPARHDDGLHSVCTSRRAFHR